MSIVQPPLSSVCAPNMHQIRAEPLPRFSVLNTNIIINQTWPSMSPQLFLVLETFSFITYYYLNIKNLGFDDQTSVEELKLYNFGSTPAPFSPLLFWPQLQLRLKFQHNIYSSKMGFFV